MKYVSLSMQQSYFLLPLHPSYKILQDKAATMILIISYKVLSAFI